MTNEQRKKLVDVCQDNWLLGKDSRHEMVKVICGNVRVTIDYYLDRGTGSGAIVAVSTYPYQRGATIPTVAEVDELLIRWAKEYRLELGDTYRELGELLEKIA